MASDYSAMPPRLYRLYHDKSKDNSSLRTDDIKGAQPRRFNYAKGDILDKYNNAKSQVSVSQEPKNFMFWSPPETKRDEIPTKPYQAPYQSPYDAQRKAYDNPYGPRDYRSPPPYQSSQIGAQYPDKYANVNQARNPMFSNNDYTNQQQASNRNTYPIQPQNRYQDSLDTLHNQYGGKSASPLNPQSNLDQEKFSQNLNKFFGVEPTAAPRQTNNANNAGVRDSHYGVRSSAALTPQPNIDPERFNQNLNKFFGVEPTAVPRQVNNVGPRDSQYGGVRSSSVNVHSSLDQERFNQNLNKFFGVDPNAPRQANNVGVRGSQAIQPTSTPTPQNNLIANEQFKKNQALFFGAEETKQVSRPQPVQTNHYQNYSNQNYNFVARNPLGFGNVQTYQRVPANNYAMPEMRSVQDEWKFKKNAEAFFG